MIATLSALMLVSGSLNFFIAIFFLMLYLAIRRMESEGNLGFYGIFAVLAAVNAVFLFSFTALLNAGGNLDTRDCVNRVTIVAATFLVPIAVHFYKSFFEQPGRRLLRVFYGLSTVFALLSLPSHPAFLLKQPYQTSSYYSGLVFGWAFRLWGGYVILLSLYALAVLIRAYRRSDHHRLSGRRAVVILFVTNAAWMITGIMDDLTGIQVIDLPPLTWIGSFLVVLSISWILITHINKLYTERNRFYRELIHDQLTGAYSRSYADIQLQTAIEGLKRRAAPVYLAICDVDRFKQINDGCGHLMGDKVLRAIARTLQKNLRHGDVLARYGGDEFMIILTSLESQAAIGAILDRLQDDVRRLRFTHNGERLAVTCSFGVAWSHQPGSAGERLAEQLFIKADEALYRSKHAGRDRATIMEITAGETEDPSRRSDPS